MTMSARCSDFKPFANKSKDHKAIDNYSYVKLKQQIQDKPDKDRSVSLSISPRVQAKSQSNKAEIIKPPTKQTKIEDAATPTPIIAVVPCTTSIETLSDEALLLNEDNNVLIQNYMVKMGIKDKVDFNNNLNRLKIYKKILEEATNNTSINEPISHSQFSNCEFNIKLIDLSNKLLQSHQENTSLVIKVKELDQKQTEFEKQIQILQQENNQLSTKIKELQSPIAAAASQPSTNYINSNNQSNINIHFNLNDQHKSYEELIQQIETLIEENDKLKRFQSQVFDFSRSADQLTSSVIDTMKNVNIIIEQFNIGAKNDLILKKLIEQYFSKLII